jgi:hypothetical protein
VVTGRKLEVHGRVFPGFTAALDVNAFVLDGLDARILRYELLAWFAGQRFIPTAALVRAIAETRRIRQREQSEPDPDAPQHCQLPEVQVHVVPTESGHWLPS